MAGEAHFRHSTYLHRDDHPDFFVRTATIARQRQTWRYIRVYTSHGVREGKTDPRCRRPDHPVFERPPCPKKGDDVENRDRLLTPGEVASLFRVDPKTVTRWAASGRIGSIRTPGGHRRFRESEVRALLRGDSDSDSAAGLGLEASEG